MIREEVMRTAEKSIKENRDLLRLLAEETFANRKILQKEARKVKIKISSV